ncbi:MAG: WG repeat-containing protein [Peptococcaceae bacterium]|nr:WG repeat-containing protein [Peptococcaceae bacterium]
MSKTQGTFIILLSLVFLACTVATIITYQLTTPRAFDTIKSGLIYDTIHPFYKGRALVEKDGKCGYINTEGDEVVPLVYDRSGRGYFPLFDLEKAHSRYVAKDGKTFIVEVFDDQDKRTDLIDENNWRWVEKDGKEGIIDADGNVIIPLEYDLVGGSVNVHFYENGDDSGIKDVSFYEGRLRVLADRKWGFIDRANTVIIPLEYDYVLNFDEGIAHVEKDGKSGYVDTYGTLVIPLEYDSLGVFTSEGLIRAGQNGKWGFCDIRGNVVIPLEYDGAGDFVNGFARVEKDGKHGYIDTNGQTVISLEYEDAHDFSQGFAAVKKNGKWGCVNAGGNLVVPLEYDSIKEFNSEGVTGVLVNEKWGFMGADGIIIIPPDYDYVTDFVQGLAAVKKGAHYGYINKSGTIIIPLELEYDLCGETISEGLVPLHKDGKWGFADITGHLAIPLEYTAYQNFKNGEAIVAKHNRYGIIDKRGKSILPFKYDRISKCDGYDEGYIAVQNGTWSILKRK